MNGTFNINQFFEKLFNEPPPPKNTIDITFNNLSNTKELFEMLYNIFIKGLNIKFGNNDVIDIKYISNNDFNIFQKYFESMGLKLHCDIFHILQICSLNDIDIATKNTLNEKYDKSVLKHFKRNITKKDLLNYKNCKSNKLIDYKNQVIIGDNIYIIYFSFIV